MRDEFFPIDGFFGDDNEPAEERIQGLADLASDTSDDFFVRIHQSIERRSTAAHFASFACDLSPIIVTELAQMFTHVLRVGVAKTKGKQ